MTHEVNAHIKSPAWHIRSANAGDVQRLVSLSGQLGYVVEEGQLSRQLSLILARNDHAIFIAVNPDDHVLGWLHIFERSLLFQAVGADLGGLVVDELVRGQGIGRALLDAAERWVQERELKHLTIRSNTARTAAQAFYLALDYKLVKTSNTFKKVFSPSASW
jgi:GNAT superfamily N-acetyltransferase